MALITKIEVQKRNKERVNIYIDGEYALAISAELVYKENLRAKMEVDIEKLKDIAQKESYIRCKDSAIRMIERSYKTEKEVRDKLLLKGYDEGAVEKSIEFLKNYNFLNDENYCKAFIKDKLSSRGKQKIKYDLIKKGIDKSIIENQLSNVDYDDELETAIKLAEKKYRTLSKSESDEYKLKGKLYRFLVSKGYSYDMVKSVVKKIIDNDNI